MFHLNAYGAVHLTILGSLPLLLVRLRRVNYYDRLSGKKENESKMFSAFACNYINLN